MDEYHASKSIIAMADINNQKHGISDKQPEKSGEKETLNPKVAESSQTDARGQAEIESKRTNPHSGSASENPDPNDLSLQIVDAITGDVLAERPKGSTDNNSHESASLKAIKELAQADPAARAIAEIRENISGMPKESRQSFEEAARISTREYLESKNISSDESLEGSSHKALSLAKNANEMDMHYPAPAIALPGSGGGQAVKQFEKVELETDSSKVQIKDSNKVEITDPVEAPKQKDSTEILKDPDLREKRERLEKLANEKITDPENRERFLKDMKTFENRLSKADWMSPAETLKQMGDTYESLSKLLSADSDVLDKLPPSGVKPNTTNPDNYRTQAAEQIMHQAADPTKIDQGRQATCPTAALQIRQFTRTPAHAARLINDVMLTGRYKATAGGKSVDLLKHPVNLYPDEEAQKYNFKGKETEYLADDHKMHGDPSRSYASQLYDVAATNLITEGKGFEYVQDPKVSTKSYALRSSNGEIVKWEDAISRQIGVRDSELVKLNEWITGTRESGFVIRSSTLNAGEAKDPELRKFYDFSERDSGVNNMYSTDDLPKQLQEIRNKKLWPPIASINTKAPPIGKVDGGPHDLVIHEISPDEKHLGYDNTWGMKEDHLSPSAIETSTMAKAIEANKDPRALDYINSLKAQIKFKQTYPKEWEKLKKSWLDFPDKLTKDYDSTKNLEDNVKKNTTDAFLIQWARRHPEDKEFKLWTNTLQEWFNKYPEERPVN